MTTWTYHFGVPNRSGAQIYVHLIRWKHDPDETLARGFTGGIDDRGRIPNGRAPNHWRHTQPVDVWKERILHLLHDGEPRTFNRICVELTGTTADVWHTKEPDEALWALCEEELVAWACEEGCVFWLRSDFVKRDRKEEPE